MAHDTVIFVSKRLQVVAAAVLSLMLVHLALEITHSAHATGVTRVRQAISLSRTVR
jgi:archaellin